MTLKKKIEQLEVEIKQLKTRISFLEARPFVIAVATPTPCPGPSLPAQPTPWVPQWPKHPLPYVGAWPQNPETTGTKFTCNPDLERGNNT